MSEASVFVSLFPLNWMCFIVNNIHLGFALDNKKLSRAVFLLLSPPPLSPLHWSNSTAKTRPHCLLSLSHFSFLFKYRLHSSCSCSHSFPTARRAAERLSSKPRAGLFRPGAHCPRPLTHTNKQNHLFLNRPASCIAIVTALGLFLIQSRSSSGFTFMSSRARKEGCSWWAQYVCSHWIMVS